MVLSTTLLHYLFPGYTLYKYDKDKYNLQGNPQISPVPSFPLQSIADLFPVCPLLAHQGDGEVHVDRQGDHLSTVYSTLQNSTVQYIINY